MSDPATDSATVRRELVRRDLTWLREYSGATQDRISTRKALLEALSCVGQPRRAREELRRHIRFLREEEDDDSEVLLLYAFGFRGGIGKNLAERRDACPVALKELDQPARTGKTWIKLENREIERLVDSILATVAPVVDSPMTAPNPTITPLSSALPRPESEPGRRTGQQPVARYEVLANETVWTFTDDGHVQLDLSRRIRSLVDDLDLIHDHYTGSGNPRLKYRFRSLLGCEVVRCDTAGLGRVEASLSLPRRLQRGDIHLMRYVIEFDPDSVSDEREELRPYAPLAYAPDEPTLREYVVVRFTSDNRPTDIWVESETTTSRLPGRPDGRPRLALDRTGCVQYEFADIKPGLIYAVCWEWPSTTPTQHRRD